MKIHYRSITLLLLFCVSVLPLVAQSDAEGDTLRFGAPFRSGDYDPISESDDAELVFFDLVYDTLLALDVDGNVQPRLATEWTLTDETLDLTLRQDAVFSDGTPFNAEAAQANLERAIDDGGFAAQSTLRAVTGVEAVDEFTLRITHDNSDPFFLYAFADYPAMMVSPQAFETTGQVPVGTGPYTLVADETVLGSLWVFERNPDHWDAENISIENIEIRLTGQPDLVNGLLAGDLDGILVTDSVTRTLPTEGYTVLTTEVSYYALVFWDRAGELVPELANSDVRCALSQAIDVPTYNQAMTGVSLKPMQTIPPTNWYGASGLTKPAYDPDAARAALEAAGAAGFTLPMTTFPSVQAKHEALTGFLTEVGVNVESDARDTSEVYSFILGGGSPAGYLNMNTKHFSLFVESHIMPQGAWNPMNVVDEDIAALVEEARTLSLDEAEPLYEEISRLINERCYFIPLSVGSTAVYMSPEVAGVEGRYRTNGFVDMRALTLDR